MLSIPEVLRRLADQIETGERPTPSLCVIGTAYPEQAGHWVMDYDRIVIGERSYDELAVLGLCTHLSRMTSR
jgi:hypothetical protein